MILNHSLCQTFFGILCLMLPVFAYAQTGVNVSIRVLLQGALMNDDFSYSTLMRDDLRVKNYLPIVEPYSNYQNYDHLNGGGGEMIADASVFQIAGENSIVDWVFVELRDIQYLDSTLATRSALLTRRGDIVDVDGTSPLHFSSVEPGEYHVVVRHRNHLGVMTGYPIQLSQNPTYINFTDPNFPTNGVHAQSSLGNRRALWCGDLNQDGRIMVQGPGNEILKLFTTIMYQPNNTYHHQSFIAQGYLEADANFDGQAIFAGKGNDKTVVFMATKDIYLTPPFGIILEMFVLIQQIP